MPALGQRASVGGEEVTREHVGLLCLRSWGPILLSSLRRLEGGGALESTEQGTWGTVTQLWCLLSWGGWPAAWNIVFLTLSKAALLPRGCSQAERPWNCLLGTSGVDQGLGMCTTDLALRVPAEQSLGCSHLCGPRA